MRVANRIGSAAAITVVAMSMAYFGVGDARGQGVASAQERSQNLPSQAVATMSRQEIAVAFVGDWRDERNRWWFAIDEIVGNEVRSARFRLASFKEGRIEGDTLTLVSKSCIRFIGCYEYYIEGKLISPSEMDMHAITDTCRFEKRCTEVGEPVHLLLVREGGVAVSSDK